MEVGENAEKIRLKGGVGTDSAERAAVLRISESSQSSGRG